MNAPLEANLLPYVVHDMHDGVVTLTLNRGERFNPLSHAMIAALQAELDRIAVDASVRSVVIAANGRGFCAGHDLKELRAHPDLAWQQALFSSLRDADADLDADSATGDCPRAWPRDRGGLPARVDVRSRRRRRYCRVRRCRG